MTMYILFVHVS